MSDKHDDYEVLSAYLDAESENRLQVERRLYTDPEFARRYHELRKTSEHVRQLPAPPVRMDFANRVVERLPQKEPAQVYLPNRIACATVAVAAVVMLVAGVGALLHTQNVAQPQSQPEQSDAAIDLITQLERTLAPLDASQSGGDMDLGVVLNFAEVDPDVTDSPWGTSRDWYDDLMDLAEEDASAVEELLRRYLEDVKRNA